MRAYDRHFNFNSQIYLAVAIKLKWGVCIYSHAHARTHAHTYIHTHTRVVCDSDEWFGEKKKQLQPLIDIEKDKGKKIEAEREFVKHSTLTYFGWHVSTPNHIFGGRQHDFCLQSMLFTPIEFHLEASSNCCCCCRCRFFMCFVFYGIQHLNERTSIK